ncbi:hypothetical protein BDV37DRAFT_242824 [Aspergillus pseudonomiae]|uniref:Uncharacterized protein n=1 Tax=Aspergillus pseudonomiae TaxID=1506151 RepID=A0A5N7DJV6_9EURO|nr:uncharacterized protein BDV37DRAFT_242824 [Aspergillus pseudonomiae]KAE8406575.1 hypothetical protein BDV37DRAFT_242824 [Aspergillus pseudonomiae]
MLGRKMGISKKINYRLLYSLPWVQTASISQIIIYTVTEYTMIIAGRIGIRHG